MRDFSDGVDLGVNEDAYQAALQEYRDGLVIGLNRSRKGRFTLHNATCGTLSYDLEAKGSPTQQKHRSGKVLFRDHAELDTWLDAKPDLTLGDLNRCSRCM